MQKPNTPPTATEAQEQEALFRWAAFAEGKWPALSLLYHIPNEGKRSAANGAALQRQGLRAGFPDICLPVARGGYHALYIELKRFGEKPSKKQRDWLEDLREEGNAATWCCGWAAASEIISKYLKGEYEWQEH